MVFLFPPSRRSQLDQAVVVGEEAKSIPASAAAAAAAAVVCPQNAFKSLAGPAIDVSLSLSVPLSYLPNSTAS